MLTLTFKKKTVAVVDYAEASARYSAARDNSGQGASTWGNGKIYDRNGTQIAYISYNGKVWAGTQYQPDATPLFDPYA